MTVRKLGILAASLALIVTPATAFAGGKHNAPNASAACSVSGGVVVATGLPTDQVINFMVTTSGGTTGWVLGFTADGAWSVNVAAAAGSTTYQFVSRTYGSNGSKYNIFAACSV